MTYTTHGLHVTKHPQHSYILATPHATKNLNKKETVSYTTIKHTSNSTENQVLPAHFFPTIYTLPLVLN